MALSSNSQEQSLVISDTSPLESLEPEPSSAHQGAQPPTKHLRTTSIPSGSCGTFPCFPDGDVLITLKDRVRRYVWRLHSHKLASAPELRKILLGYHQNDLADGINYYLTLSEHQSAPDVPMLVLTPLQDISEVDVTMAEDTTNRATVKLEDDTHDTTNLDSRVLAEVCSSYDSLFRHLYGLPLRVDTANVQRTLFQIEVLLPVVGAYGCLKTIRPHLGNLLSQYRHRLFEAIAQNPSRWMNISIPLESESIYTEAFIHLAGSFHTAFRHDRKTSVSPSILSKIKRKNEQLKHAQESVIGELFRLTIHVADKPVKMNENFETWITVQLFRDWLAVELDKIERRSTGSGHRMSGTRPPHATNASAPFDVGTLMRSIHRGGDSYLPYDKVLKEVKDSYEYLGSGWDDLADDLRSLKQFAAKTVENLCRNNLMLDPDSHKIPYLTCVDVGLKDLPWLTDTDGA